AFAIYTDEVFSRVPGPVIDQIRHRIIGAGKPGAATPVFAAFAGPTLGILLDGLELPQFLASIRLDAVDFAGRGEFAGSRAEGQHVIGQHRRRSKVATVAIRRVGQLDLPQLLAGFLIESDAPSVDSADEHFAPADRDAAAVGREQHLFCDRVELRL